MADYSARQKHPRSREFVCLFSLAAKTENLLFREPERQGGDVGPSRWAPAGRREHPTIRPNRPSFGSMLFQPATPPIPKIRAGDRAWVPCDRELFQDLNEVRRCRIVGVAGEGLRFARVGERSR